MDLIGESVRLRAHTETDATFFASVLVDAEVVRFLNTWAWVPYGPREALEYVRTPRPDAVGWTIECRADGMPIGSTGLHGIDHRNRNCMWGIWIGPPERWGHGFGTEACRLAVAYAFNQLAMEKVSLDVYEGNDRARRSYEKAGFAREGLLRRHLWLNGRLADIEVMAVFRDHPLYAVGKGGSRGQSIATATPA
jgi:RimJ/RimL family protein N-acetyltransferase